MRRRCLVAAGVVVLMAGVSVGSVAVAGSEEDVAAINKIREMEAASVNEGTSEHIAKIYAADVEYLPPNEPALKGTEAIKGWLEAMLEHADVSLEYTAADVKVVGDWAIEQYAGVVNMTPKAGGETMTDTLRGMHVYKRGEDGSWKITHDIWNYEKPLH